MGGSIVDPDGLFCPEIQTLSRRETGLVYHQSDRLGHPQLKFGSFAQLVQDYREPAKPARVPAIVRTPSEDRYQKLPTCQRSGSGVGRAGTTAIQAVESWGF